MKTPTPTTKPRRTSSSLNEILAMRPRRHTRDQQLQARERLTKPLLDPASIEIQNRAARGDRKALAILRGKV